MVQIGCNGENMGKITKELNVFPILILVLGSLGIVLSKFVLTHVLEYINYSSIKTKNRTLLEKDTKAKEQVDFFEDIVYISGPYTRIFFISVQRV